MLPVAPPAGLLVWLSVRVYTQAGEIDWGGLPVDRVVPERIPDVSALEPLVVWARYRGTGSATVQVRGRIANRAVSFTNHRSAFYYTQTHVNDHPEHAWFRGFNIAGRRVFSDYGLTVDGVALDPASCCSCDA